MPIRTPIYFSELYGVEPTEDDVNKKIAQFANLPTVQLLAMINTFLSFYRHDEEEKASYVQGFLIQNFASEEVRKRLPKDTKGRLFFHRQQLLFLIKKLLLKDTDGKQDPNHEVAARYELGMTCLMINDLLNNKEQAKKLEALKDENEEAILSELFVQLIGSSELSNPGDVMHSIVRSEEFFNIFQRRNEELKFKNGQTVTQRFCEVTGLDLQQYLWMAFCLCVVYEVASDKPEDLIANPGKFNIDLNIIFAQTDLPKDSIRAFFKTTTTNANELTETLRGANGQLLPELEFTAFRTYPLFYLNEERTVATTLDFQFLTDKLSAGVFHTTLNSIKVEDNKDWHTFTGFWGKVFEEYVNDRLREGFPLKSERFYASPHLTKGNQEAFDGAIDYGNALVVMEYKGTYLTREAKYSGQLETLMEGINKNVGKAVTQLADGIEKVFGTNQQDTFSQRTAGKVVYTFRKEDAGRVKKIYPVIIVQDFALSIGLANYKLRQELKRALEQRKIVAEINIMPLSLITIEDFEKAVAYIDEVKLTDILDEYISPKHEPLFTFENALVRFIEKQGIAWRDNQWIVERRTAMNKEIKEKLNLRD